MQESLDLISRHGDSRLLDLDHLQILLMGSPDTIHHEMTKGSFAPEQPPFHRRDLDPVSKLSKSIVLMVPCPFNNI